jgi:phosphoribosylaminoimidazolecarboxamide formyltransferase / IMP cyclohydrolase
VREGSTSLNLRYDLACKAFDHTAEYDSAIAGYLAGQPVGQDQKLLPDSLNQQIKVLFRKP